MIRGVLLPFWSFCESFFKSFFLMLDQVFCCFGVVFWEVFLNLRLRLLKLLVNMSFIKFRKFNKEWLFFCFIWPGWVVV